MSWAWLLILLALGLALGLIAGFVFGPLVRWEPGRGGPTPLQRIRAWLRGRVLGFLWPARPQPTEDDPPKRPRR